jgi:NADH-quinone oxidoreductase subunit L
LAFTGKPRDAHTYEHAHESPLVMTIPLMVLALFSLGVGWGPEFWKADGSLLGQMLAKAEPAFLHHAFLKEIHAAHEHHLLVGLLALGAAVVGAGAAIGIYALNYYDADKLRSRLLPVHTFLMMKWYFDELYDALFVRPVVALAFFIGRFDKRTAPPEQAEEADRRVDPSSVDGVLSAIGLLMYALGQRLRAVQSGLIRRYVLVLVLTTVVMLALLSVLAI